MGNSCFKQADEDAEQAGGKTRPLKRPRWRSDDPLTAQELKVMREEFWDTEPHYGGNKVIWDALRACCEADLETAKAIIDGAGIILASDDLTISYDERGSKYELPKFVVSDPLNLIRNSSSRRVTTDGSRSGRHDAPQQLEMT